MRNNTRTAKQAYQENSDQIAALMQTIQMALSTQKAQLAESERMIAQGVNWAHVGTLADINSKLQDIADQLTSSGEYAE